MLAYYWKPVLETLRGKKLPSFRKADSFILPLSRESSAWSVLPQLERELRNCARTSGLHSCPHPAVSFRVVFPFSARSSISFRVVILCPDFWLQLLNSSCAQIGFISDMTAFFLCHIWSPIWFYWSHRDPSCGPKIASLKELITSLIGCQQNRWLKLHINFTWGDNIPMNLVVHIFYSIFRPNIVSLSISLPFFAKVHAK